jgi:fatty acid desaturase
MIPCSLPNSENLSLPNIKYLWFLLPFFKIWLLSDDEKSIKLTKQEIILRGTIISIIITVPSLVAFIIIWILFDNLIFGAITGAVIHFIAMGFSLKISKKILVKK